MRVPKTEITGATGVGIGPLGNATKFIDKGWDLVGVNTNLISQLNGIGFSVSPISFSAISPGVTSLRGFKKISPFVENNLVRNLMTFILDPKGKEILCTTELGGITYPYNSTLEFVPHDPHRGKYEDPIFRLGFSIKGKSEGMKILAHFEFWRNNYAYDNTFMHYRNIGILGLKPGKKGIRFSLAEISKLMQNVKF